jgi:predicted AAA+ superfamily ATPase
VFLQRPEIRYLQEWRDRADRKPLVVRGARQVGKTALVQQFGQESFASSVTVDLEQHAELHGAFGKGDPRAIAQDLSLYLGKSIVPGETLLFLDEIQTCPRAIAALRYFREEMPELHVIAAGSLLDLALRDFQHSMPVGRIEYLHLLPMGFQDFLVALGQEGLAAFLRQWRLADGMSDAIHAKLLGLLRQYFLVGGMPEAVATYAGTGDLVAVQRVHSGIVSTLFDDLAKYGTRAQQQRMRRILEFVPRNVGQKLKYVRIDPDSRSADLKAAFELLEMSRLVHRVRHTSANGIPLAAEASDTHFKPLFLDVGLANRICGLSLYEAQDLLTVREGALAEQFVGQELRTVRHPFEERPLFYWHREAKSANAEVDYLWSRGGEVVPLEVKAGATGSLKSMQVFLREKSGSLGVRFNLDLPSRTPCTAGLRTGDGRADVAFDLLSLPLYLCGELDRLLAEER